MQQKSQPNLEMSGDEETLPVKEDQMAQQPSRLQLQQEVPMSAQSEGYQEIMRAVETARQQGKNLEYDGLSMTPDQIMAIYTTEYGMPVEDARDLLDNMIKHGEFDDLAFEVWKEHGKTISNLMWNTPPGQAQLEDLKDNVVHQYNPDTMEGKLGIMDRIKRNANYIAGQTLRNSNPTIMNKFTGFLRKNLPSPITRMYFDLVTQGRKKNK